MVRRSQYKYTNCILSSTTVSQWCQWKFTERSASLSWTICSLLRSQFSSSILPSFQQLLISVLRDMHFCLFPAACWKQPAVMQKCVWGYSSAWEPFKMPVIVGTMYVSAMCSRTWEFFFVTNKSRKRKQDFISSVPRYDLQAMFKSP